MGLTAIQISLSIAVSLPNQNVQKLVLELQYDVHQKVAFKNKLSVVITMNGGYLLNCGFFLYFMCGMIEDFLYKMEGGFYFFE